MVILRFLDELFDFEMNFSDFWKSFLNFWSFSPHLIIKESLNIYLSTLWHEFKTIPLHFRINLIQQMTLCTARLPCTTCLCYMWMKSENFPRNIFVYGRTQSQNNIKMSENNNIKYQIVSRFSVVQSQTQSYHRRKKLNIKNIY